MILATALSIVVSSGAHPVVLSEVCPEVNAFKPQPHGPVIVLRCADNPAPSPPWFSIVKHAGCDAAIDRTNPHRWIVICR